MRDESGYVPVICGLSRTKLRCASIGSDPHFNLSSEQALSIWGLEGYSAKILLGLAACAVVTLSTHPVLMKVSSARFIC